MFKEDKEVLNKLLNDYGSQEILEQLVVSLREQADNQSDLGLKEQAIKSSELASLLFEEIIIPYFLEV